MDVEVVPPHGDMKQHGEQCCAPGMCFLANVTPPTTQGGTPLLACCAPLADSF